MRTTLPLTRRLRAAVRLVTEALATAEPPDLPPITGWARTDHSPVRRLP